MDVKGGIGLLRGNRRHLLHRLQRERLKHEALQKIVFGDLVLALNGQPTHAHEAHLASLQSAFGTTCASCASGHRHRHVPPAAPNRRAQTAVSSRTGPGLARAPPPCPDLGTSTTPPRPCCPCWTLCGDGLSRLTQRVCRDKRAGKPFWAKGARTKRCGAGTWPMNAGGRKKRMSGVSALTISNQRRSVLFAWRRLRGRLALGKTFAL